MIGVKIGVCKVTKRETEKETKFSLAKRGDDEHE